MPGAQFVPPHSGMRRPGRLPVALLAAATVCSIEVASESRSAGAAGCSHPLRTGTWWDFSQQWRYGALIPQNPAPAGLLQRVTPTGTHIELHEGRTGHTLWRTPRPSAGGGLIVPDEPSPRQAFEVTSGDDECGGVAVNAIALRDGRRQWTRQLAGLNTTDRPYSTVRAPGSGDFNGDGREDLAVVRAAEDRPVPNISRCMPLPGQACHMPATSWFGELVVLDGKSGRVLVRRSLGQHRAAQPAIAWISRTGADWLALSVPQDDASVVLQLFKGRTSPAWSTSLAPGLNDVSLLTTPTTVTTVTSAAGFNAVTFTDLATLFTITTFDATSGAQLWARTGVAGSALTLGNGALLHAERATGVLTRLDARTGTERWATLPLGPVIRVPVVVGDIDGRGIADLAVTTHAETLILSGETGTTLLHLGSDLNAYPTPDVTGDSRRDLIVIEHPQADSPTVVLYQGGRLTRRWASTVPLAAGNVAVLLETAGGQRGTVLIHSPAGNRIALRADTGKLRWTVAKDATE